MFTTGIRTIFILGTSFPRYLPNRALILPLMALFLCPSPPAQGECPEKIVWSRQSPNLSLVFKNKDGRVQILLCRLRIVESQKPPEPGQTTTLRRVFDGCEALNPDRKEYLESDLDADWRYVWDNQLFGNLMNAAQELTQTFFVTMGGTIVGQKIAGGISTLGSRLTEGENAVGPPAKKAAQCADGLLGLGQSFTAASKIISEDKFLRFFPAYIGLGAGMASKVVNEFRHREIRNGLDTASTLAPSVRGATDAPCDPIDLGTVTVEQFADSLKKALTLAEARPDSPKMREERERLRRTDPRLLDALNRPPESTNRPTPPKTAK